jgi:hypothetical protein
MLSQPNTGDAGLVESDKRVLVIAREDKRSRYGAD